MAHEMVLRELTDLADFTAAVRLFGSIWGMREHAPVNTELLRAFVKAGDYVAGAFDGPELVGACVGFFGPPAEATLHSHIAGVSAAARGRDVGYALKLHQRDWARARGAAAVAWTFDPLVRRNAYFNIGKLGAEPVEYLVDFYGRLQDDINRDDETDRLLVRWPLDAQPADTVLPDDAVVALGITRDGVPVPGTVEGTILLVAVPDRIDRIRTTDPVLARTWRHAVRETLVPLMSDGARVTGFHRAGWYVLRRDEA